jgi:membrane associated rhomboid family serine protease
MKRFWHRVRDSFTPGVRTLLGLLTLAYLVIAIGDVTGRYHLEGSLVLSSATLGNGDVWTVLTYVLVPLSLLNFLMNGLMIAFFGGSLERSMWSRRDFAIYCLVAVVAPGIILVVSPFSVHSPLAGSSPLVLGLLIAWGFIFRREKIPLAVLGETTAGLVACVAVVIDLVSIGSSSGVGAALVILGGGLLALLYLWLGERRLMTRPARVVASARIDRLEL